MKRIKKSNISGQEVKKCKIDGIATEFNTKQVSGKHQCHILQNICGEIKLAGAPYFSLVLDNGSEVVPMISVDSPRHLVDWISFVGRNVMIKELVVVSESFQNLRNNSSTGQKNYLVKRKNVILLESKDVESRNKNNNILETERNNIKTKKDDIIIGSPRTCRIVVHHVSTPFHITEDTSCYCLALISYTNRKKLVVIVWLVLKEEQVAWREFMVPNREYLLHFPPGTDKFFFDKAKKPLDTIMEKNIREIRVMFHHKMLFSRNGVLNGSVVPEGSKMYLSRNTNMSEYIYRFTVDLLWFRHWFSTSEADHACVPLVTLYGKVTSIKYLEEEVYQSCYLCINKNPREPVLSSPKSFNNQVWMDPFKSGLVLEENEIIDLPNVTDIVNSRMQTGVPGELVQVISLEDLFTGEERCIYIKHSFVKNCQQMVRLAVGVTVCVSHLNRRCSKTGKFYYLTTMLSCCRVLDYTIFVDNNEGWGMFGLCHKKSDDQVKMWGVLEPFSVTKVGIRAKCNHCGALFSKGNCTNSCGGIGAYSTSAHAIAWINVIQENKRIARGKVIIKDDLARKLLSIPKELWVILQEAAAWEEIVAFRNQVLNEESDLSSLRKSFQMYCFVKSREKFYISVKKLHHQDGGRLYLCLNLEPMNIERLNLVAGLLDLNK